MQAVLDQLAMFENPPIAEVPPHVARELPSPADAVVALLASQGTGYIPEAVGDVTHRVIPGADGAEIVVRIYTPAGDGPFPVVVYFHGGGWVIANLNTYDASARALTNAAQAIVVSVAYRQSPENPFPTPVEDAYAATQWVMANATEFNGDTARVAVAGESAGGNMATVVSLMAKDRGGMMPIYQLLVYPVTQLTNFDTPSYQENADAVPLNKAMMQWFAGHYVPNEADRSNPYVSPLLAEDVSGLPPATIITAQIDPLRSDGEDYANKLTEAGVSVVLQNYEGVTHEFFGMQGVVDEAKQALELGAEGLRNAFGSNG
ncbi:MAG: alpha/beta hydrolase [Anaerolineae bacterium]|nr:alpha/beta hydrolase [Anaerolineae bacterium]